MPIPSEDQTTFANLLLMENDARQEAEQQPTLEEAIWNIHQNYLRAHGLVGTVEPVRVSDAERELSCNGFYSLQAIGR